MDWTLLQVWIEFGSHTSLAHLKHEVAAFVWLKYAKRENKMTIESII
jgi:hypothetical protein